LSDDILATPSVFVQRSRLASCDAGTPHIRVRFANTPTKRTKETKKTIYEA